jgi:hypothetical protein
LLQVGLAVLFQIGNYRIRLSISQTLGPKSETLGGGKFWWLAVGQPKIGFGQILIVPALHQAPLLMLSQFF